jgi:hypothetical protein
MTTSPIGYWSCIPLCISSKDSGIKCKIKRLCGRNISIWYGTDSKNCFVCHFIHCNIFLWNIAMWNCKNIK